MCILGDNVGGFGHLLPRRICHVGGVCMRTLGTLIRLRALSIDIGLYLFLPKAKYAEKKHRAMGRVLFVRCYTTLPHNIPARLAQRR